jgi:hypothetical protein
MVRLDFGPPSCSGKAAQPKAPGVISMHLVVYATRLRFSLHCLPSRALTFYQIFAGYPPYHGYAIVAVLEGRLPPRPSGDHYMGIGFDDLMWELMVHCWRGDPTERPTASDLALRLRKSNEPRASDGDEVLFLPRPMLMDNPLLAPTFSEKGVYNDSEPDLVAGDDFLIA